LRDAVEAVFADRLVECVGQVQPPDMSVSGPAEVIRLHIMIAYAADRRRARDEIVLIEVPLAAVEVRMKAELRGVALPNKILLEDICDKDLLVARVEFIQVGIGVLLAHVERDHIVLPEIVVVVAEDTEAKVRVVENEAAEIADERLNAEARGN